MKELLKDLGYGSGVILIGILCVFSLVTILHLLAPDGQGAALAILIFAYLSSVIFYSSFLIIAVGLGRIFRYFKNYKRD